MISTATASSEPRASVRALYARTRGQVDYRPPPELGAPAPPSQPTTFELSLSLVRQSIYDDFVIPLLRRCATDDEFFDALLDFWSDFLERLRALRTLVAITRDPERAAKQQRRLREYRTQLEAVVARLSVERGADELDFAFETCARAVELGARVDAMGPPTDVEKDRDLCGGFHNAMGMHIFAIACLCALEQGHEARSDDVVCAIVLLLRTGAVDAYSFARKALSLRQPDERSDAPVPADIATDRFARDLAEEHVEDAEPLIHKHEGS